MTQLFKVSAGQRLWIYTILASVLIGVPTTEGRAEDEVAMALERAKRVVAFHHDDVPLTRHPVLTTSNPARGTGPDGSMALWLNEGRPVVAVAIYKWENQIVHEVDALARSGELQGKSTSGQRWIPEQSGVDYRVIRDTPPPGDSAIRRRLQLNQLARLFSVTMLGFNDDNSDREQLRLLPKPIYRYQLDAANAPNDRLIDGAVFAFVQGTDPEALLIIEAIESTEGKQWEYALVRSTAGALEGRIRGDTVFTAEKFPPDSDMRKPHFTFRHPVSSVLRQSQ